MYKCITLLHERSINMLVRCEKHPSKPYHYTANPEWRQYQAGQTVFGFNSNIVKIELEPLAGLQLRKS